MRADWQAIGEELTRFLAVGGLTLLLNNAIVIAFTEVAGFHYLLSIIATTLITTLLGFMLNRQWTFRKNGVIDWREMLRYFVGVMCNLCVVMVLTWGLVRMGLPYYVACLIVAAVMTPINFILHRHWSFGMGRGIVPSAGAN
jgi:dolichol-phosphate mannosyltransferase